MSSNSASESRYRTLLEISTSIAKEPSLDSILQSLRKLLSSVVRFESIVMLLLDERHSSVEMVAMDMAPGHEALAPFGLKVSIAGTTALGRAIQTQKPVYVADSRQELQKIPELAERLSFAPTSGYIVPVSTSRRELGALVFGLAEGQRFSNDDVELMTSISSHVAVALESALSICAAELYQRQLAQERDRLRFLLEINNDVITHLDVIELCRAACVTVRKFFDIDFAGFWLLEKYNRQLECAVLDFPGSKGFIADVEIPKLTDEDYARLRARTPEMWSAQEMDEFPEVVRDHLRSESIQSMISVPLTTAGGPVGIMTAGSRRNGAFGQPELDLLSQAAGQIALAIDNALAYRHLSASKDRLEDERLYLESEIRSEYNFEDIVGKSAGIKKVLEQVAIVAPTGSTVLLHGETGTGKELVARAIHSLSPRSQRTFVRLNCAAIPSGLVESELFGHEKGAFTGALMQKRGRFEIADHGTLFLDEIGDISLELQPKLLRAIQEQEFERLGSTKTVHVDVRLIAATHRDLSDMIQKKSFREDLFYRLNVFPIEIPPLRERREDIPLLVHYFTSRFSRRMQKTIRTIPTKVMDALVEAPWPGNIRELENFIERAVILSRGDALDAPVSELKKATVPVAAEGTTFEKAEREAIINALKASGGRIAGKGGAAEQLGLKRTTLQNKMRKLQIVKSDYAG